MDLGLPHSLYRWVVADAKYSNCQPTDPPDYLGQAGDPGQQGNHKSSCLATTYEQGERVQKVALVEKQNGQTSLGYANDVSVLQSNRNGLSLDGCWLLQPPDKETSSEEGSHQVMQ